MSTTPQGVTATKPSPNKPTQNSPAWSMYALQCASTPRLCCQLPPTRTHYYQRPPPPLSQ
eukprot:9454895-Lingulodinium_polyedra.AAC.1